MTYQLTPKLGLHKVVKGSSQQFDSDIIAGDYTAIDDFAVDTDSRLDALEGAGGTPTVGYVADLAALNALSPTPQRGSVFSIGAAAYTGLASDVQFLRVSGAWKVCSANIAFATKGNLDTFITAISSYLIAGQRFWTTTAPGYEWTWNGTTVEPTRVVQSTTAPTAPVTGQLWVDTTP